MKDFKIIKRIHKNLDAYESKIDPTSEDFSFFKELKESVAKLYNFITLNKEKPLPISLLKNVGHGCVRFQMDSLDNYVLTTIKPNVADLLQKRRKDTHLFVTNIFNAIYNPLDSNTQEESFCGAVEEVKKFFQQGETIPLSEQTINLRTFHYLCDQFLSKDLIDKHDIYIPLTRLVKKQFPINESLCAAQEEVQQRKALLEPYKPIRFPAGDYTEAMKPLLHRFRRLTVKPGNASEYKPEIGNATCDKGKAKVANRV